MTTVQLFTAEELLQMPDDGFRYELVKGELLKMAPVGDRLGDLTIGVGWTMVIQDLFA